AVSARQVDDDAAWRRLEARGFLVREAEERDVGSRMERSLVRDEPRHAAPAVPPEAGIEGRGRLAGERVRAEGIQLEGRVREHAIQRLLADVAGGADDGDARHLRIMHIGAILCADRKRSPHVGSTVTKRSAPSAFWHTAPVTNAETVTRPLRRDAERNRDRIVDAARTAIASEGIDVSVEEIARRAGVG